MKLTTHHYMASSYVTSDIQYLDDMKIQQRSLSEAE